MPVGVRLILKCFPSLLPHTWLRTKLAYNNTNSSVPFMALSHSSSEKWSYITYIISTSQALMISDSEFSLSLW